MNNTVFTGVATAIVTPMTQDGIDFEAFGRLIDWQIEQGVNAIVAAGTTGEGSTLTDEEHRAVIKFTVDRTAGRVPVIAGTGSNDTAYGIELSRYACEVGCDALLLVTPYYNKATPKGLIQNFLATAEATDKPIILYNVPSRTGVNIEPETYAVLAEHPNIYAIKEASGDFSKLVKTVSLVGDKLDVYSGNDDQVVPMLALGAKGVISVLSNVLPEKTVEMCDRFFNGDVAGSASIQCKYLPLINALFSDVNPIPVKEAMAMLGYCTPEMREPLYPMDEAKKENLRQKLIDAGLNAKF
jgi:4-hydroxy-tetrahydrodipicolinate synthase